ncbi:MAG TPA: hypothetical protein VMD91_14165 [Candidatus Sulfotelmatobacter sp.]|nr:hypothetical protein [Candidatus Sulfotelmatobacter sp.]
MGREARCYARWGEHAGEVTVQIEPPDLIARGAFRVRAPLATLVGVRAENGTVRCSTAGEEIVLDLGATLAPRWAAALVAAPPSLAKKLSVGPTTRVWVSGDIDDDELASALDGVPRAARASAAEMLIVRTDDAGALRTALGKAGPALAAGVALWVVYVKGKNAPLGETAVRAMLRGEGLIDRKVAAVSARLTALQFTRRKG